MAAAGIHRDGFHVHELTHTQNEHNSAVPMGNSHPQANPKASINLLIAPLGSLLGEKADYLGRKVSESQHILSTISSSTTEEQQLHGEGPVWITFIKSFVLPISHGE